MFYGILTNYNYAKCCKSRILFLFLKKSTKKGGRWKNCIVINKNLGNEWRALPFLEVKSNSMRVYFFHCCEISLLYLKPMTL